MKLYQLYTFFFFILNIQQVRKHNGIKNNIKVNTPGHVCIQFINGLCSPHFFYSSLFAFSFPFCSCSVLPCFAVVAILREIVEKGHVTIFAIHLKQKERKICFSFVPTEKMFD